MKRILLALFLCLLLLVPAQAVTRQEGEMPFDSVKYWVFENAEGTIGGESVLSNGWFELQLRIDPPDPTVSIGHFRIVEYRLYTETNRKAPGEFFFNGNIVNEYSEEGFSVEQGSLRYEFTVIDENTMSLEVTGTEGEPGPIVKMFYIGTETDVQPDPTGITYPVESPVEPPIEPTQPSNGGGGGCNVGFSPFGSLLFLIPLFVILNR